MTYPLRIVSYGGGRDSTALLVLAARGVIDFPVFVFSNVGDDSENPASLSFVRDVAVPFAERHGVQVVEVGRVIRNGQTETLRERIERPDLRSIDFPMRMNGGGFGNRKCTMLFKRGVVKRWCREHGAGPENPATVAIGFSTDELGRVSGKPDEPWERKTYPLLDLGMSKQDCIALIRSAGLPVPPKSSCYFCPFKSTQSFAEMRRDDPELFEQACQVEDNANAKRRALGRDDAWLTSTERPLRLLNEAGGTLFDGPEAAGCDDGFCWT